MKYLIFFIDLMKLYQWFYLFIQGDMYFKYT